MNTTPPRPHRARPAAAVIVAPVLAALAVCLIVFGAVAVVANARQPADLSSSDQVPAAASTSASAGKAAPPPRAVEIVAGAHASLKDSAQALSDCTLATEPGTAEAAVCVLKLGTAPLLGKTLARDLRAAVDGSSAASSPLVEGTLAAADALAGEDVTAAGWPDMDWNDDCAVTSMRVRGDLEQVLRAVAQWQPYGVGA